MVRVRVLFLIKLRTVQGFTSCWMRMFPSHFSVFHKLRLTVCHEVWDCIKFVVVYNPQADDFLSF